MTKITSDKIPKIQKAIVNVVFFSITIVTYLFTILSISFWLIVLIALFKISFKIGSSSLTPILRLFS